MREPVTAGRWSGKLTCLSPAVKVGNLLFISGTLALNDDLEIVGVGDTSRRHGKSIASGNAS